MKLTVLTGGIGGAKLVAGLCAVLPPESLTAIVNTGDDFRHLGLHVSPDVDTLLYTLSGKANRALGWGREGESWHFMAALGELGGPDWFNLGDGDLALHVLRSHRLASGDGLAAITRDFARSFGIAAQVLPMSEMPVRTMIGTGAGEIAFQDYFVRLRCEPAVRAIRFAGAEQAEPAPGVIAAIEAADHVMIAPSNPYLSIDPILAVAPIRRAIAARRGATVAVSPIIGGDSVKGPTAKLMRELGVAASHEAIAAHYAGLIGALLIDSGDDCDAPDLVIGKADTLMRDDAGRARVASAALALAESLTA